MKKETSALVFLAALGAAFLVVSALVVLSRGHPWLISKKLRLGGLILGLNAAAVGMPSCVSCYAPPLNDSICLGTEPNTCTHDDDGYSPVVVSWGESTTLFGRIYDPTSKEFSFRILEEATGTTMLEGDLELAGSDRWQKNFEITIDESFPAGAYELRIYKVALDAIETEMNQAVGLFSLHLAADEICVWLPGSWEVCTYDPLASPVSIRQQGPLSLLGRVEHTISEQFSFQILQAETNETLLEANLQLRVTESRSKDFEIVVDDPPAAGEYILRFHNVAVSTVRDEDSVIGDFELWIR